jgi:hypothetical protein
VVGPGPVPELESFPMEAIQALAEHDSSHHAESCYGGSEC